MGNGLDLNARLERIPKKLLKLAAADEKRYVFGADSHKYRLNPCLTESAVARFETENRIQLPADYRAFLLQVGNGGAGPFFGMYRLEKCLEHLGAKQEDVHPELPFPHTSRWCPWDEWEEMGKPQDLVTNYEQQI